MKKFSVCSVEDFTQMFTERYGRKPKLVKRWQDTSVQIINAGANTFANYEYRFDQRKWLNIGGASPSVSFEFPLYVGNVSFQVDSTVEAAKDYLFQIDQLMLDGKLNASYPTVPVLLYYATDGIVGIDPFPLPDPFQPVFRNENNSYNEIIAPALQLQAFTDGTGNFSVKISISFEGFQIWFR